MAGGAGLGAFAGGLANGLNNIMGLYMQNKYYSGLNDNREETNRIREEALQAKIAKGENGGSSKGGDYEGFDKSLIPIFQAKTPAPQSQPQANTAGLAPTSPTTLPDAGMMTANPAGAYQGGGLANVTPPPQAAPADTQEEQLSPRQQIVKEMMFGNLANEPDKLNAIAAAAALHGLGKEVTPWLEGIYKAKKSGIFDGAMNLINNNVDGAIASLKQGGINLADRPTKVNPDDPNDHKWNINIEGTGQRVMDVKNMVGSTMDPEKFLKWQTDMQDSATKSRVADAQINNYNASAKESMAGAGLKNTQAKAEKVDGSGGLAKLPAPAATAEWLVRNKVYDNYKDAFNAVKTLNDKSPDAARASLIESAMKNGSSLKEAAAEVDDFLASGKSASAPKSGILKFNPKTGGFD